MMRSVRLSLLLVLGSSSLVRADLLTINNLTQTDVWVATYYNEGTTISRVGKPVLVLKQSSAAIERPKRKLWCNRELVFDYHDTVLAPTLTEARWRDIKHKNIGLLSGDTFFIVKNEGELFSYTSLEWNYLEPLKQWFNESYSVVIEPLIQTLKEDLPAIANNPHKDHIALVRDGNDLHPAEKLCVSRRRAKAKVAMEKMIGVSVDQERMPTIAIVASGGGYRAMISTVGYLLGAERMGLLDSTIYLSALSGSTWTLCSWYATGLPLKLFRPNIIDKMNDPIFPISGEDMALITEAIVVKLAFGQPVTLVDVYGALLANVLLSDFGDNRHRVYLSDQVKRIRHGEWPFPIYTAIRAEEDATDGWYEFTPFEVGGQWIGRYVPTWAFGRKFVEGTSVDYAPEQSLGFQMGTFGSAFAARVSEIYDTFKDDIPSDLVRELIEQLVVEEIGNKRLTYAEVFNYVHGLYRERFEDLEKIRMADGGLQPGFNLPYPVVSGERNGRKADVMIFLDMSWGAFDGSNLYKAEEYARAHGLKFPTIAAVSDSSLSTCKIFKDEHDPEVPVVIYLPLINDKALWSKLNEPGFAEFMPYVQNFDVKECVEFGDCGTFDLHYEAHESNQLSKLAEFNMLANKEQIVDVIAWKTAQLQTAVAS
jgi:phospholipase A2